MRKHRSEPCDFRAGVVAPYRRSALSAAIGMLVAWMLLHPTRSAAQFLDRSELGLPLVEHIDTEAFGSTPANWSIVQDDQGIIVIGNDLGVWEFDGRGWRYVALDNGSAARSLARGADGQVFVGGQGTFGVLASDSVGLPRYVSLSSKLPDEERGFGDVWDIAPLPSGTYFRATNTIFRLDEGVIHAMPVEERLYFMRTVGDRAVVSSMERGLLEVTPEGLRPLPGGEQFAGFETLCPVVLEHEGGGLLLVTFGRGLFVLEPDGTARPFTTPVDELLAGVRPYHGLRLTGGRIALATMGDGLIVLESDGRLAFHLHDENGLPEPGVNKLGLDREGALWVLHGSGILRVHAGGAITHFETDLSGNADATAFARLDGRLFATSFGGVFTLNPVRRSDDAGRIERPRWERLEGSEAEFWDVVAFPDLLVFAAASGLFTTRGERLTVIAAGADDELDYAQALLRPRSSTDLVFVGHRNGVSAVRRTGPNRWEVAGWLPDFSGDVKSLAETADGTLFIGTVTDGIYRSTWHGEAFESAERVPVWPDDGRVAGQHLFMADGDVLLGFSRAEDRPGLQRYHPGEKAFLPDSSFGAEFASGELKAYRLVEDADDGYWLNVVDDERPLLARAGRAGDGRIDLDLATFRRLPAAAARSILPEPDGTVWVGTQAGVFRIDPSRLPTAAPVRSPHIRRVRVGADSTVYAGPLRGEEPSVPPVLRANENDLRFEYASPAFDSRPEVRYQYRMEGLNADWSAWTNESYRDFIGLQPGGYTFGVRARDAYGQVSEEASFAFRILPPWYLTWWAYLVYGLLFAGTIALGTRYAAQIRLRAQIRRLETERRLHEERARISRDLHDHVGAQLSNIISAVELIHLSASHGEAEQMMHYLDGLDDDARATISRLRETIWAIHNESITVEAFGTKVDAFAQDRARYQPDLSVSFDFEAAPAVAGTTLRPMQALHLFRIAQEAVSNAVKHAEARRIAITLHLDADRHLHLEVRDDGRFKRASPASTEGGFGLNAMRERAEQIGGDLHLDVSDDGTAVRISLPVTVNSEMAGSTS